VKLLEQLVATEDLEILAIPLSDPLEEGIWAPSKEGVFTVKRAYWLLEKQMWTKIWVPGAAKDFFGKDVKMQWHRDFCMETSHCEPYGVVLAIRT